MLTAGVTTGRRCLTLLGRETFVLKTFNAPPLSTRYIDSGIFNREPQSWGEWMTPNLPRNNRQRNLPITAPLPSFATLTIGTPKCPWRRVVNPRSVPSALPMIRKPVLGTDLNLGKKASIMKPCICNPHNFRTQPRLLPAPARRVKNRSRLGNERWWSLASNTSIGVLHNPRVLVLTTLVTLPTEHLTSPLTTKPRILPQLP